MGRPRTTIDDVLGRLETGPMPSHPSRPVTKPCRLWTGGCFPAGYGSVSIAGKTHLVHVVVYEHAIGVVPDGCELDHVCRVRRCAELEHLEPVTHLINGGRSAVAMRSRCSNGHEMTDENTYHPPAHPTQRACRKCRNDASTRSRQKG